MFDFEDLDHYELLGVPRSASAEDIKRAYRREISKFHPDRFATAAPDEQVYAERRSQRLSEANRVLSDFASRTAYSRNLPPTAQQRAAATLPSTRQKIDEMRAQPRDHQAELYDLARLHLEHGRVPQAVSALRQLQQLNPFYRDSAALLQQAEAQLPARRNGARSRPLLIGGGIAGAAVIALAAWGLARRDATPAGRTPEPTQVIAVANAPTTFAPEPSTVLTPAASPARSPIPTSTPEPVETAETVVPEATTVVPPTSAALPVSAESGAIVLADDFSGSGWADTAGNGWSVGYQNNQYHVTAMAGAGTIWSYRSGAPSDASIGVDMRVLRGSGGLLLRFSNEQTYLNFNINNQGGYQLEQHSGGAVNVLASGQSAALFSGPTATNRIVARMRGTSVTVLANGQLLATADATGVPASRRYGLLAVGGAATSDVLFENMEIRALE